MFPDGRFREEEFFNIGNFVPRITLQGQNFSLVPENANDFDIAIENNENLEVRQNNGEWTIISLNNLRVNLCNLQISYLDAKPLQLSVFIPYPGASITTVEDIFVEDNKIVSFWNLSHYFVTCCEEVDTLLSYDNNDDFIYGKTRIGRRSLQEYEDQIEQVYTRYSINEFNRDTYVLFEVGDKQIRIRKFVLDSSFDVQNKTITITDATEENVQDFVYEGTLYALPIEEVDVQRWDTIKLERGEGNTFAIPDSLEEFIVFSGIDARRRIIPKYYSINGDDFNVEERRNNAQQSIITWGNLLDEAEVEDDKWKEVCKAYEICERYNIPFRTHNGLKVVCNNSQRLTKFVFAMFYNGYKDHFLHGVNRFENENAISLHCIPMIRWVDIVENSFAIMPECIRNSAVEKFRSFLKDVFSTTLSMEYGNRFVEYIFNQNVPLLWENVDERIRKIFAYFSEVFVENDILPAKRFVLTRSYIYLNTEETPGNTVLQSAMCVAENACGNESLDLFDYNNLNHRQIVNFYHNRYRDKCGELFCLIVLKIINNI